MEIVMKKRSLLLLLFFLITKAVFSQESCYNLDFETGTLNGWEGATGQCCPAILSGYQIVEGRHTMMKGSGFDPNTCNKVPVVAPGGLYSVRLGNEINGKEFETLSYALNVTEDNALFIYKYAVVLQDPNHPPEQQPYFRVNVFNENQDLIDPACGSYNVIATSDIPGFESCFVTNPLYNQPFTVVYKNWTTVGLDLTAYIGRKIIIEFQTGDCTRGGHFGYAYVDAYCSPLKIGAAYCSAANGTILSAPIGFSYLWDTGETTQSIRINNPIDGAKYNCEMLSVTGCKVTISTIITLLEPVINFEALLHAIKEK